MSNCLDFRRINKASQISDLLPFDRLHQLYMEVEGMLNQLYPEALDRTRSEIKVELAVSSFTKLQILKNYWIGNCNVDVFIPALSGDYINGRKGYSGLAIEIDGYIHDKEFKIKKDLHKIDRLKDFGILVYSLKNEDIESPQFISLLRNINQLKTIDSRRKKRMFRNIYVYTIFVHRELMPDRIQEVLGPKGYEFFIQLERYYDR